MTVLRLGRPQRLFAAAVAVVAAVAIACFWPRGEIMYARMSVELYQNCVPEELSRPGALAAGQKVTVIERQLPWVRVRAQSTDGWLPEWYLALGPDHRLPASQEYFRVVRHKCRVYLYPDDAAPTIGDLDRGKVVKVAAEYGDWRYVHIIVFDIPAVSRGWVRAGELATGGEVEPKEGCLPTGTTVYIGDPTVADPRALPSEVTTYDMTVSLDFERSDWVYVSAAGGWTAWVAKADIVFSVPPK